MTKAIAILVRFSFIIIIIFFFSCSVLFLPIRYSSFRAKRLIKKENIASDDRLLLCQLHFVARERERKKGKSMA